MSKALESFVAGKPDCFAIPQKYHGHSPTCERCPQYVVCGTITEQIVDAFEAGTLTDGAAIRGRIREFKIALKYWYERDTAKKVKISEQMLNALIPRSLAYMTEDDAKTALVSSVPAVPIAIDDILVAEEDDIDALLIQLAEETEVPKASLPVKAAANPGNAPSMPASIAVLPPAPTARAASTTAVVGYKFPMPSGRAFKAKPNAELTTELQRLVDIVKQSDPFDYASIREAFCAVSIEMNLRQQHAPQFRPLAPLNKKPVNEDERTMSRDRQVIDVHWRAYSADKPILMSHKYPSIFNTEPFVTLVAEKFASENLKPGMKVTDLVPSEAMQLEHAIIKESKYRDQWRTICFGVQHGDTVKQDGAIHVETIIRNAINASSAPNRVNNIAGMLDAWKARKLVGSSPNKIARMIGLMTGENRRDASAVTKTLKSVDRHLGTPKKP